MIGLNLAISPTFRRGASSYSHNMVVFDGTNDYATRGANLTGLGDSEFFTLACKFRVAAFPATSYNLFRVLLTTTFSLTMNSSGSLLLTVNSGGVITSAALAGPVVDTDHTVHVYGRGNNGATSNYAVILDGVNLSTDLEWTTPDVDINFSTGTNFVIGANGAGANKFAGRMGFVWFDASNSAANSYVTDTTKFYNGGDVDLGADGSNPSHRPLVFFGGRQTAADWNAGTNLGTGGAFTMNPDGVT